MTNVNTSLYQCIITNFQSAFYNMVLNNIQNAERKKCSPGQNKSNKGEQLANRKK